MPDWARITTGVRSTRLPPPGQWIIYYQELQNNYSHSTPAFSGIAGITRCAQSCPRGAPGSRVSPATRWQPSHGVRLFPVNRPPSQADKSEHRQGRPENRRYLAEGDSDVDLPGFQAVKVTAQWIVLVPAHHPPSSITNAHQRRPQPASAAARQCRPRHQPPGSLLASQAQIASGLLSHPTPDGLVADEVRAVARQVHQP